jgi:O-antigen/teichoic acid export membrane protein
MNRLRQYFEGAGALVAQSILQRLLGLATTAVLARILGPTLFGTFTAVQNTSTAAYGVIKLGTDASIHVHSATVHGDQSNIVLGRIFGSGAVLLLIVGLAGLIGIAVSSDWLATTLFGEPELAKWIPIAGLLVFLQCASQFYVASLAGLNKFLEYSRVIAAASTIGAVMLVAGCAIWGLTGAIAAAIATQLLTVALLARLSILTFRRANIHLTLSDFKEWTKRHVSFGLGYYAAGLISIPVIYYFQALLVQIAGIGGLGELRVVASIVTIVSFVPAATSAAFISLLSRSSAESPDVFAEHLLLNLKLVWSFALTVALGLFLILPQLIKVVFGLKYMNITMAASIAIIGATLACVLVFADNALLSRRRVTILFGQSVVQTAGLSVAALLLIPTYGLIGYFLADLAGTVVGLLFLWVLSTRWRKKHITRTQWLAVAVLVTSADALGLLMVSTPTTPEHVRLITAAALLVVSTFVMLRFILTNKERLILWNAVISRRQSSC